MPARNAPARRRDQERREGPSVGKGKKPPLDMPLDVGREFLRDQEALRQELRAYYDNLLSDELRAKLAIEHGSGPETRKAIRQMAKDGWLGIGWPKEYGGQGRSQIEQFIFFDESMRAGAPVPMLTINTVGPTLMKYGSDEIKNFFLPKILAGEIHFCIGYTESQAGTDLAALSTAAVRDGDEYVINGQKVFKIGRASCRERV